jgi:entericidin B
MFRRTLLALVAGSIALSAAACNTVKGAGKDVQSASQSTEDAINGR